MEIKIATNIETEMFYAAIKFLKEKNWVLTAEYDDKIFDKGIDFDFYRFEKNEETIVLAWSNWFEGEIKATTVLLNEIAQHFKINLNFGNPEFLQKPNIIEELKDLIKQTK